MGVKLGRRPVIGAGLMGLGVIHVLISAHLLELLPERLYQILILSFLPVPLRVLAPLLAGGLLLALAVARLSHNLLQPFRQPGDSLGESLYQFPGGVAVPSIVAIGGGTGMPSSLRGIKEFTSNITAVVTVADDGVAAAASPGAGCRRPAISATIWRRWPATRH